MIELPTTRDARIARIQHGAAQPDDLEWLRVVERDGRLRCDCRCYCHQPGSGGALTITGADPGSCGLLVTMDKLDCDRGCRSAHVLASECEVDAHRPKAGAHV